MLNHFQPLNAQEDSLIAGVQGSLMLIVLIMLFAASMDVPMFVKGQDQDLLQDQAQEVSHNLLRQSHM